MRMVHGLFMIRIHRPGSIQIGLAQKKLTVIQNMVAMEEHQADIKVPGILQQKKKYGWMSLTILIGITVDIEVLILLIIIVQ